MNQDKGRPVPGRQYRLTGATGTPSIMQGNTWAESEVAPELDHPEMRAATVCAGCGSQKQQGLVLCWQCYKYRQDITAYKYFHGSMEEWLDYARSGNSI